MQAGTRSKRPSEARLPQQEVTSDTPRNIRGAGCLALLSRGRWGRLVPRDLSRRESHPASHRKGPVFASPSEAPRPRQEITGRRSTLRGGRATSLRGWNKSGREELESAFDRSRSPYICPQKQRREHSNSTSEVACFATVERRVWRWFFSSSPPNGVASRPRGTAPFRKRPRPDLRSSSRRRRSSPARPESGTPPSGPTSHV